VGVGPGDPRADFGSSGVRDDTPKGDGDGETEVEGSQSDETPVAAVSQVGVGGDEILELFAPPHEREDGEDWT